jgi:predicted O-methyltransferase YrrM
VEELRGRLLKDRGLIMKTDFGSGAHGKPYKKYPVKISRLARFSSLPARRAGRLFYLIRFLKANSILELGTSLGISAGYMAKANPEATILTLEGCPVLAECARENMIHLGLKNVEVVDGEFGEVLPGVLKRMKSPDLVFLDGNHREKPTLDNFNLCLSVAHNDTMFVFDDIHYSPGMEAAWNKVIRRPEVTVSIDLFHQGWVILKKELSSQHFILRHP